MPKMLSNPRTAVKGLSVFQADWTPRPEKIALLLAGCLLAASPSAVRAESDVLQIPRLPSYQVSENVSQYLVYINGESDLLLEQVRKVEPEAFRTNLEGRTRIQAGVFDDRLLAERRVKALEREGIGAEIATIGYAAPPPLVPDYPPYTSSLPSPVFSNNLGRRKNYFVVIPAPLEDLQEIENQVIRLGAPARGVRQREVPRGTHVRVGPFAVRDDAERWNSYLLDFGLTNARVYYGK